MNESLFAITVVVLVLFAGAGVFLYTRKRGGAGARNKWQVARRAGAGSQANSEHGDSRPEKQDADSSASLEGHKLIIHSLLQGISEVVKSLLGASESYSGSLKRHEEAVSKTATVEGLRDLERAMLQELRAMRASNETYREQLDEAKSKVKNQREELERLQSDVGVDFLTHIPNRRSFQERFEEEVERAKRYGNDLSLLVCDIDHFKRINDEHGHLAGDRILRGVASQLDSQKRSSDFLARYGGEEFVIILPETPVGRAKLVAEEVRRKVGISRFRFEKSSIRLKISCGVAELKRETEDADAFFKRADEALYRAKDRGRNRVETAL